jgi:small-conductance mechanosensitive channel
MNAQAHTNRALGAGIIVVVALVVVGAGLYFALQILGIVPIAFATVVHVLIAAVLGATALVLVGRLIERAAGRTMDLRRASLVLSLYRLFAYTALALILLEVAGVNGLTLLAGGTFAGLVLGLASQTVLSNLIAGISLLFVRPLQPGDRVTILTWQYGLVAPAYPPKFFSQDTLVPGYTGTVITLGLIYSSLRLDEGPVFKVPNSILIQSAIISHDIPERWVRTKYELPTRVAPELALQHITEAVRATPCVSQPDSVRVLLNQANQSSLVVSVDALCRGNLEEAARSEILLATIGAVREVVGTTVLPAG